MHDICGNRLDDSECHYLIYFMMILTLFGGQLFFLLDVIWRVGRVFHIRSNGARPKT